MAQHRAIPTLVKAQLFIAVVAIAIVIVSVLQIPPLIKTKENLQNEISELQFKIEDAKEKLKKSERELSLADNKLKEILKTPNLPMREKVVVEELISKISSVNTTVIKALADLEIPKTASVPQTGHSRQTLIADLFSDQSSVRLRAYNALMSDYSADTKLVPDLLSFASKHRDNLNGIYNTLVVLSHLNKAQFWPAPVMRSI